MMSDYLQVAGKPSAEVSRDAREKFRAGLRALDQASANIAEAGALFSSIDERHWQALLEDAPSTMRRTLSYVRQVGEGTMIPQIATDASSGAQRLRAFPVDEQAKLWGNPVEMFNPGRTGRHAKYQRYVSEMSADEVRQAFERDGRGWRLRSFDEQKSFIAEQSKKAPARESLGIDRPGRWAVRNGKVYLAASKASQGLTLKDIQAILRDLKEEEA